MSDDTRLREVVSRLTEALLEAVRDLGVTEDELHRGFGFLNEVGKHDEFPLLSDVLGISVVVDELAHGPGGSGTESNVEGPYYKPGAPFLEPPYRLAEEDEPGEPLLLSGSARDADTGAPLPGDVLDVWQSNSAGLYDTNDPSLGEFHLRGRVRTGDEGRYEFRTVVPPPYEIPKSGPVGALLRSVGRHAFRPAHLHMKVTADGYAPLTTMVFFAGDPWLGSDTIGAVKDSLVVPLERPQRAGAGLEAATCTFDVSLRRQPSN